MSFSPTTSPSLRLVRPSARRWARKAALAAGVGTLAVAVGVLAGAAPLALFGAFGIAVSVVGFLTWPALAIMAVLLVRPAIDDSADQLVLGPANALGAIGVAIFVGGTALLLVRGARIRTPAVTVPFTAFLAVGLAAVAYAPAPAEAIGSWVQLASLFVMFGACALTFRKPEDLNRLIGVVLLSAAVPVAFALFQLATGTNLETAGKGSASAAPGSISHPNGLSFFLMVVVSVGLVAMLEGPPRRLRLPLGIGLALAVAAFIGTYTRSAWVGLAAILMLLASVHYRRLFVLGGVALIALAVVLPSTVSQIEQRFSDLSPSSASYSTNSFAWRVENWNRMLPYATETPLLGHGLGSYLPLSDREFGRFDYDFIVPGERPGTQVVYAHNDYLFLAVEMGLPGALLWLCVLGGLAYAMWRARACPPLRPLATAMTGVVAAIAVGSAVDNVVLYTVVVLPLMAICGGVAGVYRQWLSGSAT